MTAVGKIESTTVSLEYRLFCLFGEVESDTHQQFLFTLTQNRKLI